MDSTRRRSRFQLPAPEFSIPLARIKKVNQQPLSIDSKSQGVFLKTGLLSQFPGSAYAEMGRLKLACHVRGPRGIGSGGGWSRDEMNTAVSSESSFEDAARLKCQFKFTPFSGGVGAPINVGDGRTPPLPLSEMMVTALAPSIRFDRYPRSVIEVTVTVFETGPSISECLSLGVVTASLALADAGIELYDLVTCAVSGSFFLAEMPSINAITHLVADCCDGEDPAKVSETLSTLSDQASSMYAMMGKCLRDDFTRHANKKKNKLSSSSEDSRKRKDPPANSS